MTAGRLYWMKGNNWAKLNAYFHTRSLDYDGRALRIQRHPRAMYSGTATWSTDNVNEKDHATKSSRLVRVKTADRDFYHSILTSTSTKREAKSYLSKFTPSPKSPGISRRTPSQSPNPEPSTVHESPVPSRIGVNLGNFYTPVNAIEKSPVFTQYPENAISIRSDAEPLRVALIKIRAPQLLSDSTLQGVGLTLSQLGRLGLCTVVVVDHQPGDHDEATGEGTPGWREASQRQVDRIAAGIEKNSGPGARGLDNVIGISSAIDQSSRIVSVRRNVTVAFRDLLLAPLRRGITPVIPPIAYTMDTHKAVQVEADDVVLALTREFAGIFTAPPRDEDPMALTKRIRDLQKQVSLERLILLDPLGGIPGKDASSRSHVFINLEQEYEDIRNDIISSGLPNPENAGIQRVDGPSSVLGGSSPFSSFAECQVASAPPATNPCQSSFSSSASNFEAHVHLRNLELSQRALSLLPPTSSALLTTPDEAANAGRASDGPFLASGVGTRRQKNPLIHNLLTDKPIYSSSLPSGRLGSSQSMRHIDPLPADALTPTTFLKRGMPLTILPDPRMGPWTEPKPGEPTLSLNDPRIDLPRLIHLIEDSFNRKLDVEHYLSRINDRIAGVIIAGEYEGGALLTWETPRPLLNSQQDATRPARTVPYLDKFAVLKRSQGAGGVADILFNAMVRSCLPSGVCWRSRRDNPVNKWYFERARGTWKIPDSNWTMFWTTEDVAVGSESQTFLDYEGVCRGVVPSWADTKKPAD
ncbi:MAG: Amino-acid acetyltransferase, mitochondrial [Sclerophora amabilis]|nr:MAG: Amino-acid acetyltransferase, mitochondrial [Sclerophora amabilis]